ncbi:MAG: hypothetical protein MUF78_05745 [Candidatus Edwardsbacteria bacterium]|jgi:hypothetical protein|nr:hypothetical protein [Candidatus Edwardsbacteria bacterium]
MNTAARCALLAAVMVAAQVSPGQAQPGPWLQAERRARGGEAGPAMDQFRQLLSQSTDPALVRSAAGALREAGAVAEAERLLLLARDRLKPKVPFHQELADLYQSQLKYREAARELAQALNAGTVSAAAGLDAIGVQAGPERLGRWLEEVRPASDELLRVRAQAWLRAGDAEKSWRSAAAISKDQTAAALLSRLLAQPAVYPETAAAMIERYLQRRPQDRRAWELRLAHAQGEAGMTDRAQRLLERLSGEGDQEAQRRLAALLLEQRLRPDEALAALDRYAAGWREPLRTEGGFLRAAALAALARWEDALAALDSLAGPARPAAVRQRALFERAEISCWLKRFDDAAAQYSEVAKLGPAGDVVNDALARMLLISEHKTATIEALRRWADGRALEAQLRFDQADRCYRELADEQPGTGLAGEAALRRAELAVRRRDWRAAADRYQELGELSADTALASEGFYRAGLLRRGRLDDAAGARRLWERGILRYPDTSWADLMRGGLDGMKPRRDD